MEMDTGLANNALWRMNVQRVKTPKQYIINNFSLLFTKYIQQKS